MGQGNKEKQQKEMTETGLEPAIASEFATENWRVAITPPGHY